MCSCLMLCACTCYLSGHFMACTCFRLRYLLCLDVWVLLCIHVCIVCSLVFPVYEPLIGLQLSTKDQCNYFLPTKWVCKRFPNTFIPSDGKYCKKVRFVHLMMTSCNMEILICKGVVIRSRLFSNSLIIFNKCTYYSQNSIIPKTLLFPKHCQLCSSSTNYNVNWKRYER